jgi:hypothetical protein
MSMITTVFDPGLQIPPPPPMARRFGVHRAGGARAERRGRRGAFEEAALTFMLGLAFAWTLVEAVLWFGGN